MLSLSYNVFLAPYTETSIMSESSVAYRSFVGVDLHQTTVTLVAVDARGEKIAQLTAPTKCGDKITDWLRSLPEPVWMAVEACPFVEWFIDRFRWCVFRMDIADATELARLRGKRRKTDPNDAHDAAIRLADGRCPLGFIADAELMQLRKLGRHWRQLSHLLSRTKHAMRSMFHAANLAGPKVLDAAAAHRWFLAEGHLLKPVPQETFTDFLDTLMLLERQRERLRRQITLANRSETFVSITGLLKTVPGIDEIWACIIAAEIGPFDRFPNADALEFWAGMTPDVKESAGRRQSGNITKAGSRTLRWALCKAAVTLCQSDAKQEATRQRMIRRTGGIKPKANVAMGRRLLGILYAMVRDGKPYHNAQPVARNRAANQARAAKRARQARKEAA
jgi:transposase